MEDLFSKLALQTVTLVGKAAFGAAGSMALRRVAAYANRVPQPQGRQDEVDRLRAQFESKLRIITPAIDLVDIISARGHSTMASVLHLTYALRNDILAFSNKLEKLDQMVSRAISATTSDGLSLVAMFRRVTVAGQPSSGSSSDDTNALASMNDAIIEDLKALLVKIEDAVPLLNLALTTSGAHLGSSLPPGISPSRLMQASALLSRSSTYLSTRSENNPPGDVMVGDPFVLRLYSLFVGSVRPKSKSDFTWKEEYAKCHVALWRCADRSEDVLGDYAYELRIIEDLDDGRYHEPVDVSSSSPHIQMLDTWVAAMNRKNGDRVGVIRAGRVICIPLEGINSLHYTSAGSLLNIEDSSSPVLVVSINSPDASVAAADDIGASENTGPEKTDAVDAAKQLPADQSHQTMRWYAMEVIVDDNHDDSESSDGDAASSSSGKSDDDDESERETDSEKDKEEETSEESESDDEKYESTNDQEPQDTAKDTNPSAPLDASPLLTDTLQSDIEMLAAEEYLRPVEFLANEWSRCTLSLLEYTIRLASVEMREQLSHLEVEDEKLRLYLLGGAPGDPYAAVHGAPGGSSALRLTQQATPHSSTTPAVISRRGTGFNTIAATPRRSSVRLVPTLGSPVPK
ncbi:Ran-specific GTPase-activating protein 30 [Coemansia sp. RSA 2559]|nr:Ran-specific GTPase-activating protein 30 [Coemansia sp. RSA 2559]